MKSIYRHIVCFCLLLFGLFNVILCTNVRGVELIERGGLNNVFSKLNEGKNIKIGFIGGSLAKSETGWSSKVIDWFNVNYHSSHIEEYNVAMGGTNSKYGVFRIDAHLLDEKRNLDLIFIKYAVNDGDGTSKFIKRSVEGLVRKIWNVNPYTDICFIYTVLGKDMTDVKGGILNLSAAKHDTIASYYNIPSIYFGTAVNELLQTKSIVWNDRIVDTDNDKNGEGHYVFSADKTHLTSYGEKVFGDIVMRSLIRLSTRQID